MAEEQSLAEATAPHTLQVADYAEAVLAIGADGTFSFSIPHGTKTFIMDVEIFSNFVRRYNQNVDLANQVKHLVHKIDRTHDRIQKGEY